jgi:hypothetical protein
VLFHTLIDLSNSTGLDMGYTSGWAQWNAKRYATMMVQLQAEDGTLAAGYDTALGGFPGAFIPPYAPMGGEASNDEYAMAVAVLYEAYEVFGTVAYQQAAQRCLAILEDIYWDDQLGVLIDDPLAETITITTHTQVMGMAAYMAASGSGVDLGKHRIPALWEGMVAAGLPLSETDATGENYSIPLHDTNNNTIWKHNWDRGPGYMYGMAPVLGTGSIQDAVTHNWTVDRHVDTQVLMKAASAMMQMKALVTDTGAPMYSEEYAYRLLHWSDQDWVDWMDSRAVVIAGLHNQIADLMNQSGNVSEIIEELEEEIADLEEQLAALQLDYNDTFENESILRNQVDWLRETLEETNETVDDLNKDIEILESKVERIQEDLEGMDENVTNLEVKLREERHNVTQLEWELENASAALDQAELDLEAAIKDRDDTDEELKEQESRSFITALIALFVGMIIVIIIMRVTGKL